MRLLLSLLLSLGLLVPSMPALAAEQQVWIQRIGGENSGEVLGSVMASDTSDGLVIARASPDYLKGPMAFTSMKTAVANQASKTESKWLDWRPVGTGIPTTRLPSRPVWRWPPR